ncbi:Isoleucine--tRNA ligase [Bienertia sinuspersici]
MCLKRNQKNKPLHLSFFHPHPHCYGVTLSLRRRSVAAFPPLK